MSCSWLLVTVVLYGNSVTSQQQAKVIYVSWLLLALTDEIWVHYLNIRYLCYDVFMIPFFLSPLFFKTQVISSSLFPSLLTAPNFPVILTEVSLT